MECKEYSWTKIKGDPGGINRNIVECKVSQETEGGTQEFVLIETLWNVKQHQKLLRCKIRVGINRNIVECKVSYYCNHNK